MVLISSLLKRVRSLLQRVRQRIPFLRIQSTSSNTKSAQGTGTNQIDTSLERVSVSTYAQQTNKNTEGRPTQIYVQRLPTETKVTLWPVPDNTTTYQIAYHRLKGIDGLSSGIGTEVSSVPPRFVPCLVAGMAYYIAMKKNPQMAAGLKQEYEFPVSACRWGRMKRQHQLSLSRLTHL